MKKLFPIMMCILLMGALALSVCAAESSVTIEPSAKILDKGETFTVVAKLTNSEVINMGAVLLDFDETVFELVDGTCDVKDYSVGGVKVQNKGGTFMVNTATNISGQLFTFEFKVKDDAEYGEYTITPMASIGNKTSTNIPATGTTVTVACKHSYNFSKLDANNHLNTCSKCGVSNEEAHDWNDGYVQRQATCTQPGLVILTCLMCQETKEEEIPLAKHVWDGCNAKCSNCDETRVVEHAYNSSYSKDASGHWYACSICGDKKDFAAHIPGAEATETTAQVCTACQYEIVSATGHTHQMSPEWTYDDAEHWHVCLGEGCVNTTEQEIHQYDDNCDTLCDVCGYVRATPPHNYSEQWMANQEGHWHSCMDCFANGEIYPHIPGPEATETEPQRCLDCNIVIAMPTGHQHVFGEQWYSDDLQHWQCCTDTNCIETYRQESHTWNSGVELDSGETQYTCFVCGKQIVTAGSEPPTVPSTAPTTPEVSGQNGAGGNDGLVLWGVIGIAAAVLLLIGVALLLFEFVRSRKVNSHGKFSK